MECSGPHVCRSCGQVCLNTNNNKHKIPPNSSYISSLILTPHGFNIQEEFILTLFNAPLLADNSYNSHIIDNHTSTPIKHQDRTNTCRGRVQFKLQCSINTCILQACIGTCTQSRESDPSTLRTKNETYEVPQEQLCEPQLLLLETGTSVT
jgi:hypothetical protein